MSPELKAFRKQLRNVLTELQTTHHHLLSAYPEVLSPWDSDELEHQTRQLVLEAALRVREIVIQAVRVSLERAARRAEAEAGRSDWQLVLVQTYHNLIQKPFRYRTLDRRIRLLYNRFSLAFLREIRTAAVVGEKTKQLQEDLNELWETNLWFWSDRLLISEFNRADFTLLVRLGIEWRMEVEWEVGPRCGPDGKCVKLARRYKASEVPAYPHPLCDCRLHLVK